MTYASDKRILISFLAILFVASTAIASLRNEPSGGVITVTAPTATVTPGNSFTVSIIASDTTGQGATGFETRIQFDPAVIQPTGPNTGCSTVGTLFAGASVTCNLFPTPNVLSIIVFGVVPISGGGPIVNVNFQAVGPFGSSSPLIFNSFVFNEGDPASVTVNGNISLNVSTAATATLSGRLLRGKGVAVSRAKVVLSDGNGNQHFAVTNSFGYFTFRDLPAGSVYLISAASKGYSFTPQAVSLDADRDGLIIWADN